MTRTKTDRKKEAAIAAAYPLERGEMSLLITYSAFAAVGLTPFACVLTGAACAANKCLAMK